MSVPIVPLILCGGSGTRLWPASRDTRPKQFLPLFGAFSTFQETVRRVRDAEIFEPPVIITNRTHRALVAAQLDELNIRADVVLEPEARDSGPAILAGTLFITQNRGTDAAILALAADHVIRDIAGFHAACRKALPVARSGHIVTFGIAPDHPATGYGYIEPGRVIESGVHAIVRFVEKPDAPTAQHYIRQGYLWNSGNFLFQASALIQAYKDIDPATAAAVSAAVNKAEASGKEHNLDAAAFAQATKLSLDYAVMEKTSRTAVVRATFDWSDVGSWAAVRELSARDHVGNAARGQAVFVQAKDNFVSSDGPLVALVGVDDLAVIATDDAVLVAHRGDSSRIKALVEQLKKSHPSLTQRHSRPFAEGRESSSTGGFSPSVKLMGLRHGERLLLQGPRDHAKLWVVIDGAASILIEDKVRWLQRHESIHIPPEMNCTLENADPGVLQLLEIELCHSPP